MKIILYCLFVLFTPSAFSQNLKFTEHVLKSQGTSFFYFQSIDIDNDGDKDFFPSYNFDTNNSKLKWYENVNGEMQVKFIDGFSSNAIVKFGKLNNVGLVDIYSNDSVNNIFYIHRQVSSGVFQREIFYQHPASLYNGYEIADFNNDSNTDFVMYEYDATNNVFDLFVYLNNNGIFTKTNLNTTLDINVSRESAYQDVYLKDMNTDGFMDIVLIEKITSFQINIIFFKNDGNGGFVKSTLGGISNVFNNIPTVRSILTFVDLSNDGLLDVFFPSMIGGQVYVSFIEQTSEDVFNAGNLTINTGNIAGKIYLKDNDNDGDLDVFVMSYESLLQYFENVNGNYTRFDLNSGNSVSSEKIEFIDLDNDGLFDIVNSEDNQLHKYKQTSNLVFEKLAMSNEVIGSKFMKGINFSSANHKDLINVSSANSSLSLYLNDGNENFNNLQLDGTEFNILGLDVYDYNNDSRDDIVVVTQAYLDHSLGVIWYENVNGQSFIKHFISNLSGNKGKFYFVDIDNDGDIDLFKKKQGNSWYENIGGVYQPVAHINATNARLGDQSYLVDFDNDGDLDVLYSGGINTSPISSYAATYWMEMDNGTFTENMIENGVDYRVFQPVDLDGDGVVEILVKDRNNDSFLWIKNGAGFTKLPFNEFPLYSNTIFKDMNNDGLLDRVFGTTIKYNMGNFQFRNEVFYDLSTSNFISLSATKNIEDINSDGFLDIIASTRVGEFYNNDFGYILLKQVNATPTVVPLSPIMIIFIIAGMFLFGYKAILKRRGF
jgi:hypothetical protein